MRRMKRRESQSRRITRLHNEWLARRGLPVGNSMKIINSFSGGLCRPVNDLQTIVRNVKIKLEPKRLWI